MKENTIEEKLFNHYLDIYPERSTSDIEELKMKEIVELLVSLPSDKSSLIIDRISPQKATEILTQIPTKLFLEVFNKIDIIKFSSLLSKIEERKRDKLIKLLEPEDQNEVIELSSYPEDSAGSLMNSKAISFRPNDSVKKIIFELKKEEIDPRHIYVTDIEGTLEGYLPVRELIYQDENTPIENIMRKNPPSINPLSPKDEVVETFNTFKISSLPLVNVEGKLLGAIRYENIMRAVQEDATSTMAQLGGASPDERALSRPVFSVAKRLPWLCINLLTAFIASFVVGIFEGTIAQITALAVLLPVVAGQSGNTGAQAMAVTMRGLALREIRSRHWIKVFFKEIRVGMLNGALIAILTGVAVFFWSDSISLSLVIGVSMIISMIIASLAGGMIPIILTYFKKDPASSASVILTTVTDVFGFLSFLGFATIFIKLLIK